MIDFDSRDGEDEEENCELYELMPISIKANRVAGSRPANNSPLALEEILRHQRFSKGTSCQWGNILLHPTISSFDLIEANANVLLWCALEAGESI